LLLTFKNYLNWTNDKNDMKNYIKSRYELYMFKMKIHKKKIIKQKNS